MVHFEVPYLDITYKLMPETDGIVSISNNKTGGNKIALTHELQSVFPSQSSK